MGKSKYAQYREEIVKLLKENDFKYNKVSRLLAPQLGLKADGGNALRGYCKKVADEFNQAKSEPKLHQKTNKNKPFVLSAWNDKGYMMDIDQYCDHYKLPRKDISRYKLVSHTGTPFFNIEFKDKLEESSADWNQIKSILKREIKQTYKPIKVKSIIKRDGVVKWADLHFGAHIKNLLKTPDYDSEILEEKLLRSVVEINDLGFKKVHVHILGDLIESLSGLNHINSWMSMNKDEIGANAIKLCSLLLHKALSRINNLGKVKIVAGNHDRMSKANDEDVKGGAADVIAFCLELMGYDVEFHPYVVTHLVEGINHINFHGDKGLSKKQTSDLILEYGIQGKFNFICEAHLHSIIEKLSVNEKKNFKVIKDDSIDHRRMHLASFFTGNYYSETLGFTTNSGYTVSWDNGRGKLNVLTASL